MTSREFSPCSAPWAPPFKGFILKAQLHILQREHPWSLQKSICKLGEAVFSFVCKTIHKWPVDLRSWQGLAFRYLNWQQPKQAFYLKSWGWGRIVRLNSGEISGLVLAELVWNCAVAWIVFSLTFSTKSLPHLAKPSFQLHKQIATEISSDAPLSQRGKFVLISFQLALWPVRCHDTKAINSSGSQ